MTPDAQIQALEDILNEVREDEPEEFRRLTRAELIRNIEGWRNQAQAWADDADRYRRHLADIRAARTFTTPDFGPDDEWSPFDTFR